MNNKLMRKILAVATLALILGAIVLMALHQDISVMAAGSTIYVDDDNSLGPWNGTFEYPYQNITSGLANATNGDTVYVLNGTYAENVVIDKSIILRGDSRPIIDGSNGIGIEVTADNVTVEGFEITGSSYGVYASASGFNITDNTFSYDDYGIYWYIYKYNLTVDYTVYDCSVKNNVFHMSSSNSAIYVSLGFDYNHQSGYDVEIGDIQICNNTVLLEGAGAWGIYVDDLIVSYLDGGHVSVGVANISENRIYGGYRGIRFYGELDEVRDVQASFGDVIISNNVLVNQSSEGMYIDYYDCTYLHGNTISTYGSLMITGNTITSIYGAYGIYLSDIGYWYDFYDNARLEVGHVRIEENEIEVGGDGIYFYGYDVGSYLYDNSSFSMGNVSVKNNGITSGGYGVEIYLEDFGYEMYEHSSFTMGDIEFSGNTIHSVYDGIYVDYLTFFGYDMYDYASFTMGNIRVNDNHITSSQEGIYVGYCEYIGEYMYGNSSFTMGNIEFCGNEINSTYDGMYLWYMTEFGYDMNDNSSFVMGSILVNDNTVNSDDDGIYFEYFEYFGAYMYGNSAFVMGDLQFNHNVIDSDGYGLYKAEVYYFGYYMYGVSSFTMGNIEVNNNVINSASLGMWLYEIDYFGNQMWDNSSFMMGSILVNNNIITSSPPWGGAMYIEYLDNFGTQMYGNSSFTMSNIQINGNAINSTHRGIYIEDLYEFGYYMYGVSSFTMGNIEVCSNQINSEYEGLYIQSLYHAYYMYNNASFTMENITICDNTINSEGDGIFLQEVPRHTRFGYNAVDNSTITTGTIEFSQNEIISNGAGMHLADLENATIRNNMIQNGSYGLYLQNSQNNTIYHNIFNNTINAYSNWTNIWDNGYPSGGNYWSDYSGIDYYGGPNQNITGGDGIGDTPYDIEMNNQDRYPFITKLAWDQTPPSITNITQDPEIPDDMDPVTIQVVVIDEESGVHNVTLSFSTDAGGSWSNATMEKITGDTYQAEIPGQPGGTQVQYRIIAYDNVDNPAVEPNAGTYYVYTVIPEFPVMSMMPLALIVLAAALTLYRRLQLKTSQN